MVYQGPSRGCTTCKRRRKKCDETRPSCMRCIKAGRGCGGYEASASSPFRLYGNQETGQSSFVSTARKCSLPMRAYVPGTDVLQEDILPVETSQAESNAKALQAFFYDYCIVSTNRNLSKGFLPSLEKLAYRLGPKSELARACQAISFASHGKPLRRPTLFHQAETFYQELLGSFARAIECPGSVGSTETRLVAMLLGLYQIVTCSESNYGSHDTHAKGLAALMKLRHSPLSLVGSSGIFSVSALNGEGGSLDHLLSSLDCLWTKSEAPSDPGGLKILKNEMLALDQCFADWQDSRKTEFKPITAGQIKSSRGESEIGTGYWPGKVETYFDLYVAGVWNVFRAARLLLIALIIKLSDSFADADNCVGYTNTAIRTVEDMIASIPYHLADNLQDFLSKSPSGADICRGKSLGGLLLIHPLYVVPQMPFLPDEMREYIRRCLLWIGSEMGFGQATLFAKCSSEIDKEYLASGCMIIWSGFLA